MIDGLVKSQSENFHVQEILILLGWCRMRVVVYFSTATAFNHDLVEFRLEVRLLKNFGHFPSMTRQDDIVYILHILHESDVPLFFTVQEILPESIV